MTRSDQWKFYLTVVFVLVSLWTLWPTFQFYSLPPKALIGQTALLEFKVGKTEEESRALYDRVDAYFSRRLHGGVAPDSAAPDSVRHPFTSKLLAASRSEAVVLSDNVSIVDNMIRTLNADSSFVSDAQFAWDAHDTDVSGRTARGLYVVGKEPLMKGSEVASAQMRLDLHATGPCAPGVALHLKRRALPLFGHITGPHVARGRPPGLDRERESRPAHHE